jgi:hydroxymethylbilane synthase
MPLVDTADLVIAAIPEREDPRDLLACAIARSIAELPPSARVGTSSLRRQAQLLALRPDLQILPIRGNIDTRLRKLKEGQYDATILAVAGIRRAGLFDPALMTPLDPGLLLPAAAQGALALQCRRDAQEIRALLAVLNHEPTARATALERQVVHLLQGDCHSPIAALASWSETAVTLRAAVAARDGRPPILRAEVTLPHAQSSEAPAQVVASLNARGASALLH